MEARAIAANPERVYVAKPDLIGAWTVLEKVVVSLRKIGSFYATPDEHTPLPPERHQEMLAALNSFMSGDVWKQLSHARSLLGQYVSDDEGEAISDALDYWKSK